jgi:hypothetical protein
MTDSVFLSYSRNDLDSALNLRAQLESNAEQPTSAVIENLSCMMIPLATRCRLPPSRCVDRLDIRAAHPEPQTLLSLNPCGYVVAEKWRYAVRHCSAEVERGR